MADEVHPGLLKLNNLGSTELKVELLRICGSMRWVDEVARYAPYPSVEVLDRLMEEVWWRMDPVDWLEAFTAHPRIGDTAALRKKFAAAGQQQQQQHGGAWEAEEQKGASGASEETLLALQEWNRKYEERYGFIFLVCATGKTAQEMLTLLRERMHNDKDDELRVAAGEQNKITKLRLQKLLGPETSRL